MGVLVRIILVSTLVFRTLPNGFLQMHEWRVTETPAIRSNRGLRKFLYIAHKLNINFLFEFNLIFNKSHYRWIESAVEIKFGIFFRFFWLGDVVRRNGLPSHVCHQLISRHMSRECPSNIDTSTTIFLFANLIAIQAQSRYLAKKITPLELNVKEHRLSLCWHSDFENGLQLEFVIERLPKTYASFDKSYCYQV